MKLFHISDVLSVTTGRLVSSRHMDGVYEILNFLTGDNLFTHQLPRANGECAPWLKSQFPRLFPDDPTMSGLIDGLDEGLKIIDSKKEIPVAVERWVEFVRLTYGMPEQVPVYEMPDDMHTHIDPMQEARAMVGDDKVLGIIIEEDHA